MQSFSNNLLSYLLQNTNIKVQFENLPENLIPLINNTACKIIDEIYQITLMDNLSDWECLYKIDQIITQYYGKNQADN